MITRPAHQSEKLVEGITAAGGETFLFPTLAIEPIPLSNENIDKLERLGLVNRTPSEASLSRTGVLTFFDPMNP